MVGGGAEKQDGRHENGKCPSNLFPVPVLALVCFSFFIFHFSWEAYGLMPVIY